MPESETSKDDIRKTRDVVAVMLRDLVEYAAAASKRVEFELTRSLLSFLKAKAAQCEELLDYVGARRNEEWFPLRENIALLKNISDGAYELIHVYYSSRKYTHKDNVESFRYETLRHIHIATNIVRRALLRLLDQVKKLDLLILPIRPFPFPDFREPEECPKLPSNRYPREPQSVKNKVDTMAVSLLNTTEEVRNFEKLSKMKFKTWKEVDFDFLSENKFQMLKVNMHILQSLYDTYISGSEMEADDGDLLRVRGRISGAFHLLNIGLICIHYYERHVRGYRNESSGGEEVSPLDSQLGLGTFTDLMVNYLAKYMTIFLKEGREFCQGLLKRYCVVKTVEVQVPPYVGFHVRPSSLVAAIVMHYGLDVKMKLGETEYDANFFPNLIMANNYLDQKKRGYLTERLNEIDFSEYEVCLKERGMDLAYVVRRVLMKLTTMGVIRFYRLPLKYDNEVPYTDGMSLREYVFKVIVFLMNSDRQLGIVYHATVCFEGPEQAVDDIAALAEANYCESETGEDLPLPARLDYLNFKRKKAR